MSRTVAIVQARIASTRLPGKVLFELAGTTVIGLMLERLRKSATLDGIVVATGEAPANDALVAVVDELGVAVFRGSEDDVLARYAGAAESAAADVVVRLTADCPLMDSEVADLMVTAARSDTLDYGTNVLPPSWPDGLDVSVFTRATLEAAAGRATRASDREHVVPWMWRHSTLEGGTEFKAANVSAQAPCPGHRWTIDEAADYRFLRAVAAELGPAGTVAAGYRDIVALLERRPDIAGLNAHLQRDAGLAKSRAAETEEAR